MHRYYTHRHPNDLRRIKLLSYLTHAKRFTLEELLIVVAIIAVLVPISIPVFTSQLHKARVAADWANVRACYAELQYDFMETEKIDNFKLHDWGQPGITSFTLSGSEIKLQEGYMWIAPEDNKKGYNILYACKKYDEKCQLKLPEDAPTH